MPEMIGRGNIIFYLYDRYFKGRILIFLLVLITISFVIPFTYCLLTDRLFSNDIIKRGFMTSLVFIAGIIGIPLAFLFFTHYVNRIESRIEAVFRKRVIILSRKERNKILNKYREIYNNRWLNLSLVLSYLMTLHPISYDLSHDIITWHGTIQGGTKVLTLGGIYGFLIVLPLFFYLIIYLFVYMTITIFLLQRIAKTGKVYVDPLHPDGCGGLGDIGNLAFFNSYPIVLIGVLMSIWIVTDYLFTGLGVFAPVHSVSILIYLIASAFIFFYPLRVFHKPMSEEQQRFLNMISRHFNDIYKGLDDNKDRYDEFVSSLEELEKLKSYYNLARMMPIWPFNVYLVKRFGLMVLSPFTMFIIPAIFDKYIIPFLFG